MYEYFFCASSGTNNSVGAAVPERSEVSLIFYLNPPEQVEESDVMPFENVINSYPNERIDPVLLQQSAKTPVIDAPSERGCASGQPAGMKRSVPARRAGPPVSFG